MIDDSEAMAGFTFSPKKEMNTSPKQTYDVDEDKMPSDLSSVGNVETKKKRRESSKKLKKLKDPLAPKRAPSSFLLFCKEERPKVVEMLGSKHPGPVAVELAKRWAELGPEVKTKWDSQMREMKAKYFKVKEKYEPSEEFLSAAAAHDEKQQAKKWKGGPAMTLDKMAPYFTHLLTNWVKVATAKPELTAQEVQKVIWKHWSSQAENRLVGIGKKKYKKTKDPNAPKHPMSAYLIYLNQTRAELFKENPTMTNSEMMAEAGKKWKSLDEESRAPFVEDAKKKSEDYYQEMAKYKGYF